MVREGCLSKISVSILESEKEPALIPFIVSGFPNLDVTEKLIKKFQEKGCSALELGLPYSDPLADGPVIQSASKYALDNGMNINKIFDFLIQKKEEFTIPLILFSYVNPIIKFGFEKFVKKAKESNVSGVIVPDLPLEEAEEFSSLCADNGIDFIMLVAPTSDKQRIKALSEKSKGFIYLVSSTGVTGVRESFSALLSSIKDEIKLYAKTPIAVGFGVSDSNHIQELKNLGVEGAIIGSAFVKILDKYKNNQEELILQVENFINSLYLEK